MRCLSVEMRSQQTLIDRVLLRIAGGRRSFS
jgi:hypothetical protein